MYIYWWKYGSGMHFNVAVVLTKETFAFSYCGQFVGHFLLTLIVCIPVVCWVTCVIHPAVWMLVELGSGSCWQLFRIGLPRRSCALVGIRELGSPCSCRGSLAAGAGSHGPWLLGFGRKMALLLVKDRKCKAGGKLGRRDRPKCQLIHTYAV